MSNFIVYKHTSPSGKCYVGITSQAPEYRWGNNGYKYLEVHKKRTNEQRAKTSKPVGQFDLEGNLIATYFGVREATRCTGINGSHIGDCCNHKPNRKTAGGFKWEWQ